MTHLPFSAVVSDLDGTLLNANHQLGVETADTLRQLEEKGVDIILASGRNHTDMLSILNKAGVKEAAVITSNGACSYNLQGHLLCSHYLDEEIAFTLMNMPFDTTTTFVNSYQQDGWFINIDIPVMRQYHKDSNFTYQVIDFKKHHGRYAEKVFFIAKAQHYLEPLEKQIEEKFGHYVSMTYSGPTCLEIMHKGVSKGSALTRLLAKRNYQAADCVGFGDGLNDKEMLSVVGKGCLMSNADPRLLSLLPELEQIGSNTEQAVNSYLRQLFALDEPA
ncbi:MAG: hypothetical protein CR975_00015 [Gammaproteobacteria bacterium]|nr:MAG: hypothetical protein CR975_00015 [Gammaproteobacteria bacterium]